MWHGIMSVTGRGDRHGFVVCVEGCHQNKEGDGDLGTLVGDVCWGRRDVRTGMLDRRHFLLTYLH